MWALNAKTAEGAGYAVCDRDVAGAGQFYPIFLWLSRSSDKFAELEPPIQIRITAGFALTFWVRITASCLSMHIELQARSLCLSPQSLLTLVGPVWPCRFFCYIFLFAHAGSHRAVYRGFSGLLPWRVFAPSSLGELQPIEYLSAGVTEEW